MSHPQIERITRKQAAKRWANGLPVVFCPSKMHPFGAWHCGTEIVATLDERTKEDFVKTINSFSYYNCSKETGNVVAFYLPEN